MHAPDLLNLRELGGLPRQSGGTTRRKAYLRSDTLDRLTPEGMKALVDYGLRTIIDLRWPEEVQAEPYDHLLDGHQVNRIHISLLDENLAAWRTREIRPYPKDMLNCVALEHTQPQILEVLQAIAQAPPGTLLFHCHSGKDRTGLISTLLLVLAEVELDALIRDYTLSEDLLRNKYLADRTDLSPEEFHQRLACPPQQVRNTLTHLRTTYGGLQGYLASLGLSEQEGRLIKSRLVGNE
jgi:protein-tyrosine phosphatase